MPNVTLSRSTMRLLQVLIVVALPLVIVLAAVQVLTLDQYVAFEYGKADFPPDQFGLTQAQRFSYATANFRFVREAQPLSALAEQQLDGRPAYNARELEHMQDVQRVYLASAWVWQLALILTLLLSFTLGWRAETRPALASAAKVGGLATAGLVGVIGLLAIVAWQFWFVGFHQVFFAAGTWSFDYSDTLIRLFPERFWLDAALTITSLSFAGGLAVAALGAWLLRRSPHAPVLLQPALPTTIAHSSGD
jgi:integral membrane protein (TIGR01906 family)